MTEGSVICLSFFFCAGVCNERSHRELSERLFGSYGHGLDHHVHDQAQKREDGQPDHDAPGRSTCCRPTPSQCAGPWT